MNRHRSKDNLEFLSGGGEMGARMREKNWHETLLGDPAGWPQSLKITLRILLSSKFPMFLWWGKDLVQFYNDAYRPSLGDDGKHPTALGQRAEECWPEIWHIIKPLIDGVLAGGESVWQEDALVPIYRNGKIEDVYWTFSYSSVPDDAGNIAGVLVVCTETTEKVESRKKIQEGEERISLAVDAAMLGPFDLNMKTGSMVGSQRFLDIFGITSGCEWHETFVNAIHPDDISIRNEALSRALENGFLIYEIRIIRPDKTFRWVNVQARIFFDPEKKPIRMLGVVRDITVQHEILLAVEASEKKFRSTLLQAPVGIAIFRGPNFVVEMANASYLQIVDSTPEKFIGHPLFDLLPEVKEVVEPLLRSVLETGVPYYGSELEVVLNRYGKREDVYFNFVYQPMREPDGTIVGIMVVATEVTDMVLTKDALQESEKQFRNLVMQSPIAMTILRGKDFVIEIANTEVLKIWQRELDEVLGKKLIDVFPELQDQQFPRLLREVYETGVAHREQEATAFVNTRSGMKAYYLDFEYAPLHDANGRISGIMITVNDVTDRVESRQLLRDSAERLRLATEGTQLGTWELNLKDRTLKYSDRYKAILGYSEQEDPVYDDFLKHLHPDDHSVRQQAFEMAIKTGTIHYETRVIWGDGVIRWVEARGKVFVDDGGEPFKMIGTIRDITDEKAYKQQIEESEKRLRIAALSGELGTWSYDPATKELTWDNATREMYWVDQYVPITVELFWEKVHPDDREPALQKMLRALNPDIADTYDMEYRIIGFPDKLKWIHAKGRAFFTEDHQPYLFSGTVLDITEKRIALEELQENEQKFRLLADSMPQFVWIADEKGYLNYFNQSVYNYSGLTYEFIKGEGWFLLVHADEQAENLHRWRHSIQTGEPFLIEHRLRRYDGEFRWHVSRAIPQKDISGSIQMWVSTSTDIHDRKLFTDELERQVQERTAELKKLNDDLVKSNIELGQFAYVASHDLQEPLRKIQTFATRVIDTEEMNLSDKGKDYFTRMQGASKRMQQLIVDLLSYSRANAAEHHFEMTDLNKVLGDVRELLKETIEQKRATIHAGTLPTINVIPYQFEQLFTNILSNALKFSKPLVSPAIEIACQTISGSLVGNEQVNAKTISHHISISDNGIGFDPQFSERIFQVFQRLHSRDEYAGTGIGLAIVKKIVENHNGIITATSELGKGVRFDIYIPVV